MREWRRGSPTGDRPNGVTFASRELPKSFVAFRAAVKDGCGLPQLLGPARAPVGRETLGRHAHLFINFVMAGSNLLLSTGLAM